MSRSSVPEFLELLNAEQFVDLPKVKEFSRHGIPDEIRGEVWMYLLGVLSPDKTSELTTARSRLQTYSSLPKSNDLVSRLATSAARKYHLRTFGTRSIEQMVEDATVDPPPLPPPSFRPDILAGVTGGVDFSRNGSAQASPLLGAERSFPPNSILPSSPTLFPTSSSPTPPALFQDDDPFSTASLEPASPSFPPPLPPLPVPQLQPQSQRVFSQFSTNANNSSAPPSIFPSPYPSTAAPPIHTFTRSMVDVLASWANQHPGCLDGLDWERREIVEGWVSTVGPFVGCLKLEAGVYWGWGEWRGKMDAYFTENPLPNRLATFMSLFRSTLPELYDYFETEEVPIIEIASRWLTSLFSQEMTLPDLSRLWDTYFSHPSPFELHIFVCLSVLTTCNDTLEELDQGEVKQMLLHLPRLDIDRILHEASNLRKAHLQAVSVLVKPPTQVLLLPASANVGVGGGGRGEIS
ncbi:hypothetical protein BDY24DRAFT_400128 [Mrakia frigida]|uniref:uncharacterized protein n=1 Tax=Mrakia frigida TaxID=29902 RepID=UPI003FCC0C59